MLHLFGLGILVITLATIRTNNAEMGTSTQKHKTDADLVLFTENTKNAPRALLLASKIQPTNSYPDITPAAPSGVH